MLSRVVCARNVVEYTVYLRCDEVSREGCVTYVSILTLRSELKRSIISVELTLPFVVILAQPCGYHPTAMNIKF